MWSQDQDVLQAAQSAMQEGVRCWLATIVAVHGSSPRPAGSMALFAPPSQTGSLSGGCVEEELQRQLVAGDIGQGPGPNRLRYGVSAAENERLGLPCGGYLEVVVQRLVPERDLNWVQAALAAIVGRTLICRRLRLDKGTTAVFPVDTFSEVNADEHQLLQCFGARQRMLLVGAGALAERVADLALGLDYDVMVCDPRNEARSDWKGPSIPLLGGMPDDAVRLHANDAHSLVITLTHDPRIDDMALLEALESRAWYVGALGSRRTSDARRQRLLQLGLSETAVERLRAPVGLPIGSKTPMEIAIAILAEITHLRRADARSAAT